MELERLKILMTSDLGAAFELFSISKRYNDLELLIESGKWCIDHLLNKKQLDLKTKRFERLGMLSDRIKEARRIARILLEKGCKAEWYIYRKSSEMGYQEQALPLIYGKSVHTTVPNTLNLIFKSNGLSHLSKTVLEAQVFRYLDLDGVYVPLSWDHTTDPHRLLSACMRLPRIYETLRLRFIPNESETWIYRSYIEPNLDSLSTDFLGLDSYGNIIDYTGRMPELSIPTKLFPYYEDMIRDFLITLYLGENLQEKCESLGLSKISNDDWCLNVSSWLTTKLKRSFKIIGLSTQIGML